MSKATLQELTIGGLSVDRFTGRRVKVVSPKDSAVTPAVCRGAYKQKVLVDIMIHGRLQQHQVTPDKVKPWWAENPDLKAEAEAAGAIFTGEVNVGRAFAAIEAGPHNPVEPSPPVDEDPPQAAAPHHKSPSLPMTETTPLPPPAYPTKFACGFDAAAFDDPPPPPPPTMDTPPPAPPQEPTVGVVSQASPDYYFGISGVSVKIDADPTWVKDYTGMQELIAERRVRASKIEALRAELKELEGRGSEDIELIQLCAQTLMQKGVALHFDAPPGWGSKADPHLPGGAVEARLHRWLSARPRVFTFSKVFAESGVSDSPLHRSIIRQLAADDYTVTEAHWHHWLGAVPPKMLTNDIVLAGEEFDGDYAYAVYCRSVGYSFTTYWCALLTPAEVSKGNVRLSLPFADDMETFTDIKSGLAEDGDD